MLGGIFLASYGVAAGGTVGNLLYSLERNGVFAYLLPFLMIFAILFGILTKIKIFESKGINVILSISVALMALQMNFVSYFFEQIFPRMGIMLAIIFVTMVLMGMFFDFNKKWVKFVFGLMVFTGIVVMVFQSFGDAFMFSGVGSTWAISYWLEDNMGILITLALLVGGVMAVISSGKKKSEKKKGIDWEKVVAATTTD